MYTPAVKIENQDFKLSIFKQIHFISVVVNDLLLELYYKINKMLLNFLLIQLLLIILFL